MRSFSFDGVGIMRCIGAVYPDHIGANNGMQVRIPRNRCVGEESRYNAFCDKKNLCEVTYHNRSLFESPIFSPHLTARQCVANPSALLGERRILEEGDCAEDG